MVEGGSSFRTQPPSCSNTSPWPTNTCAGRGGGLSLISCTSAVSKGSGSFAGCFSIGNFQVTWFEGHRFPYRVCQCKGTFIQKAFCEVFPRFILFSNHHSKGEYIKEPLVLLISQRVVGNAAANGITSRV